MHSGAVIDVIKPSPETPLSDPTMHTKVCLSAGRRSYYPSATGDEIFTLLWGWISAATATPTSRTSATTTGRGLLIHGNSCHVTALTASSANFNRIDERERPIDDLTHDERHLLS